MKRFIKIWSSNIYLISVVVCVLLSTTACQTNLSGTIGTSGHGSTTSGNRPTTLEVHYGTVKFLSEEELINQIKSGASSIPDYHLENLEFYFRPKLLPPNAKLGDIRATDDYIALFYVMDGQAPENSSNLMMFSWHRSISAAGFQVYTQGMGKIADNYWMSKTMIAWEQDGYYFQVNSPPWFTEEDALKYCVAEKVQVK